MKQKILSIFIFTFLTITLTGCNNVNTKNTSTGVNTNSSNNGNSNANLIAELEKNITSSASVAVNGKLIVFAKNSNSVPIDMEIEVEFYDKNGVILGSDTEDFISVGANSEIAVEMYKTPETWDNYKIYIDAEQSDDKSYFDNLTINHSNNGKEIAVQVTNNSNDQIDYIAVAVVYYQGDKAVGIEDGLELDVKPGRSANFNIYYPNDKRYNDVSFDSYKVFITEAYSYNW